MGSSSCRTSLACIYARTPPKPKRASMWSSGGPPDPPKQDSAHILSGRVLQQPCRHGTCFSQPVPCHGPCFHHHFSSPWDMLFSACPRIWSMLPSDMEHASVTTSSQHAMDQAVTIHAVAPRGSDRSRSLG